MSLCLENAARGAAGPPCPCRAQQAETSLCLIPLGRLGLFYPGNLLNFAAFPSAFGVPLPPHQLRLLCPFYPCSLAAGLQHQALLCPRVKDPDSDLRSARGWTMSILFMICPHLFCFPLPPAVGDGCYGDVMQNLCIKERNPVESENSPRLTTGIGVQKKEKIHRAQVPWVQTSEEERWSVVLQWSVLLWDVIPLGWSAASSPVSRLSRTLQTQICLLPPLLCCAVLSCSAFGHV